MSQISRRARVRQLAESVWPGRTVNGYANLIAARLRKLADEGSTGMLPVSGRGDGAVFFRDGQVVYADRAARRCPPRARGPGRARISAVAEVPRFRTAGPARPPGAAGTVARVGQQARRLLELTELIIDALTELLSSESRYAKFRPAEVLPAGQGRPLAVEALLAEVQRRHEVLRQLARGRHPGHDGRLRAVARPAVRAGFAGQWALLVRADGGTTPRGLAMHLGRSVFGTTIEVYRLVELGLLAVPGRPPGPRRRRPRSCRSYAPYPAGKAAMREELA